MGIDFGTSSTKVAFKRLDSNLVTPLIFHDGIMRGYYPPYCVPSIAAFDRDGNLLLGIEAALASEGPRFPKAVHRMKMVLAGECAREFVDPQSQAEYEVAFRKWKNKEVLAPRILVALFLAYVMELCRGQLTKRYPNFELDLYFFVCMPIHHARSEEVRKSFEGVLAVTQKSYRNGWLSRKLGKRYESLLPRISELFESSEYEEECEENRVFFQSETEAQIASYRFNASRKDGLHVLVDIGSGTTDVTVLNFRNVKTKRERTHCYSWENMPTGTTALERNLGDFFIKSTGRLVKPVEMIEMLTGHEGPVGYQRVIERVLEQLCDKTANVWSTGYNYGVRQGRTDAHAWRKDNLKVILAGGGARTVYADLYFKNSPICFQKSDPWGPHPITYLPRPEGSYPKAGPGVPPFERMAVAYGLALGGRFDLDIQPTLGPMPRTPVRHIEYRD